jgi:RimJ/RimL family protein N-acetyltransferase
MNMDPAVRKYFPGLLSREESRAHITTIERNIQQQGYGLFAAEWKETGAFIGFIGFSHPGFQIPAMQQAAHPEPKERTTPFVEIGWRLSSHYWGKGLATEGAKACLQKGFLQWNMKEIYSFTSIHNRPSENVMIRIGMIRQGTFPHPSIPAGSWLNEHVLYKASQT